jgi:centractin
MPDGSTIKMGSAHVQAPEVLFRPELMGYEYPGIPACVINAVQVSIS